MSRLDFKFRSVIGNFSLDASSEFNPGINFIWGRSGNGKTTLLNNLAGFLKPIQGEIKLSNRIIFSSYENINISPENRKVAYVQQDEVLFGNMNVLGNIEFGYNILTDSQKKITPSECLEIFDIKDLEKSYPDELSGGQKQKVSLARAVARNGDVLLLDEPINSLDFLSSKKIFQSLENITKDLDLCVLYITHSIDEIFKTKNEILFVDKGIANKKYLRNNLLDYWKDEILINTIEKDEYKDKYFLSDSSMISRNPFDHSDMGFYFSGQIKNIFSKSNYSMLEIKSDKDYFVTLDNKILNKLILKNNDKIYGFVYKNHIS
ncbi:MAG: ATP-binding cassette domain-containing protein [SAR202 cluster bacterium]|nr:ATP-binding cassette domain-containing protein [SAR202 cluster bacterium]|tara:strand:- start:1536 stop:2495 length:960 start_codon:yes stop_codon:yes gene_type:complete